MQVQGIDDPARLADTVVVHLAIKLPTAGPPRDRRPEEAPRAPLRADAGRDRDPPGREEDPLAREEADGEDQKEYYLNEQMQAIQKELGERDEFKNEIQELEDKLKKKKLSKEALAKVKKELKKLKMMQPDERRGDGRAQLHRLDPRAALGRQDRGQARPRRGREAILDEDHYGLKKIKERILEYLAVQALVRRSSGPRPLPRRPARRRQDLARPSIARARAASSCASRSAACATRPRSAATAARTSARCPARSSSRSSKAGATTPSSCSTRSTRCRPTSAATPLRAARGARPRAEHTFNDHYLDLDYDLSDVMFITTANTLRASRCRSKTAWRSSSSPATPSSRSSTSP
jgi:ATP-dependent Lon protease